jgi:hypothetical protein
MKKMLTDNQNATLKDLKEENRIFKQNLLTVQEELKDIIDKSMMHIQKACRTRESSAQFHGLVKDVLITNNIS